MNASERLGPDLERYARHLAPAGALLVPAGSCLGGLGGLLLSLVGVGLLTAACFHAKDGLLIFGPFVRSEVIRHTRRGRPWLWRAVYAIVAGMVLFLNIDSLAPRAFYGGASIAAIAFATQTATYWFAALLAAYVLFLTFQLMPGIVAEEREAKRWDILMATDLRPREILLGKVTGRLLLILDPVLAVAPVLSMVLLLGGVPPLFVFVYVLCLAATVFSITGASMFYSVFSERKKDAIGRTVMPFVLYFGLTALTYLFFVRSVVWNFPTTVGLDLGVEFNDLWYFVSIASPVRLFVDANQAISLTAELEPVLWRSTLKYVAAHLGIGLVFGLLACSRLRTARVWATKQSLRHAAKVAKAEGRATEGVNGKIVLAVKPVERPPVTDDSLTWWERYGHLKPGQITIAKRLTSKRVLLRVFFAVVIVGIALRIGSVFAPWGMTSFNRGVEAVCAMIVAFGTWPMFFGPLFRGAGSIAKERTQDTLDPIRLMPLTSTEIVYQKWKGVLLEMLPAASVVMVASAGLSCVLYVNPLTVLVLPFIALPGAMMCASIGVFFSAKARSAGRAVWYLLLTLFGIGYLVPTLFGNAMRDMDGPGGLAIILPPFGTGLAAMIQTSWGEIRTSRVIESIVCIVLGIVVQSILAYVLFQRAVKRFEADRTPS